MLEELHTASGLLHASLERYFNACSALHSGYSYKHVNNTPELLGSAIEELFLVESYKVKLAGAEAAVKRARNGLANVPINSLPPEVLTHIFHLVMASQPCPLRAPEHWNGVHVPFPKYPDTFSHVCSQWRQIALASPSLWSHIDIALSCPLSKNFHDRAAVYVDRANQAPLDIHLIDPGYYQQVEGSEDYDSGSEQDSADSENNFEKWDCWNTLVYENNPGELSFLDLSPKPQIRTLGLLVHYQEHPVHNTALVYCFTNCLPGGLSKLVINVPEGASNFFETGLDMQPQEAGSRNKLFISEQKLEAAWGPTNALELRGKYPVWTCAAYHGLTDLRLLGGNEISGSELAHILRSSPGLRTLHCDFDIDDSLHPDAPITPVTLQELETLNLSMDRNNTERFVRWLCPGFKPLRFSLLGETTSDELEEFFVRSNVQEMRAIAKYPTRSRGSPTYTFALPSQLRTLVLVSWDCSWDPFINLKVKKIPTLLGISNSPPAGLDTLYLLNCRYYNLRQFQEIVEEYSPRRLILWGCATNQFGSVGFPIDLPLLRSAFGNNLSQLCPHIECLAERDPYPIENWD